VVQSNQVERDVALKLDKSPQDPGDPPSSWRDFDSN